MDLEDDHPDSPVWKSKASMLIADIIKNLPDTEDWDEAFHSLKEHLRSIELEKLGCENMLEAMIGYFAEINTLTILNSLLLYSEDFVKTLDEKGPDFVKNNIPLSAFLAHEIESHVNTANELIATIKERCPSLKNDQEYVDYGAVASHIQSRTGRKAAYKRRAWTLEEMNHVDGLFGQKRPREEAGLRDVPSQLEREIDEKAAALTYKTPLDVFRHVTQMQDELLNRDERDTLRSIGFIEELRQKAVKAQDVQTEVQLFRELVAAQQTLVELHLDKRKKKQQRLEERLRYLAFLEDNRASGLPVGTLGGYHANVALQKEGISALERLYEKLVPAIRCTNVSAELAALDQQIGIIYDASFSFVVAGLISVGKSSFINCLTGHDLSPHRAETMTAIPINYVHDPISETPAMVIPFADQLNQLLERIRELINEMGKDQFLHYFPQTYYLPMISEIEAGLVLEPRYTGAPDILKYSTYIHDLFRMAVDSNFSDKLAPLLPLDWGKGLHTYLTVYVKFPADIAGGLVNLSIVDTPGINESGVKKLNLFKTIQDVLITCNHGILVAVESGLHSDDMLEVRKIFDSTHKEFLSPMALVLTHSEKMPPNTWEDRKKQACEMLAVNLRDPFLHPEGVFLVSPLWMQASKRMMEYLDLHADKKPTYEEEKKLVEDYVFVHGGHDSFEDKLEDYGRITVDAMKKRCTSAMKFSKMDETIAKLMDTAIRDGLKILVRAAIIKSVKLIESFVARFQTGRTVAALMRYEHDIQNHLDQLNASQKELVEALAMNFSSIKGRIQEQGKEVNKFLRETFLRDGVVGRETAVPKSFNDYIVTNMSKISDGKVRALIFQEGSSVEFASEGDVSKAQGALSQRFKNALQVYFWQKNQNLPKEVLSWGLPQKRAIEKKVKEIAESYASHLLIPIDQEVVRDLALPAEDATATFQLTFRTVPKHKKKGFLSLLGFISTPTGCEVDPREVRDKLVILGKNILDDIMESEERSVKLTVRDEMDRYIASVTAEIKRVQGIAEATKELLVNGNQKIQEVARNLGGSLGELRELVDRCR